jgi:hypothetical protein
MENNVFSKAPKVHKLGKVVNRDCSLRAKFSNPLVMMQRLRHRPLFSLAKLKDLGRHILWLPSPKPRGMPKRSLMPIAKDDRGSGIEDIHIIVIVSVAVSHPNLVICFPF